MLKLEEKFAFGLSNVITQLNVTIEEGYEEKFS